MIARTGRLSACALLSALAAPLAGAQLLDPTPEHAGFTANFRAELERQLFSMLPEDHQALILEASPAEFCQRLPDGARPAEVAYEHVAGFISKAGFDQMAPGHRFMLASVVRNTIDGVPSPAFCFEPGSLTDEQAYAFSLALFGDNLRYQQTNRWTSTALSGGGLGQGDPTTLTYSFPPDGTPIPNLNIGLGSGPNALHAWLNGIYGNQATWQALIEGVFDRWSDLTGLSYVYEPNDDGVQMNSAPGVAGVRGDIRIGAFDFQNDGNGGVLAYNNFPQDGDMVFDAFDTYYNTTNNNSIRFRNITAHEHGHGLGMLHVCPANGTKLMEPFINTSFDGPQTDDILNGNRHYGDRFENNNSIATATNLGNPGFGVVLNNLSIDDNNDVDYFAVTLPGPRQILVSLTPAGGAYQQGTQTSQCNTGSLTDYDVVQNLSIDIIAPDGVTVLTSVNDNPAGQSEFASTVGLTAGTYFIRIDGDNTNGAQLYDAGFTLLTPDPIVIDLLSAPPEVIEPGATETFQIRVTEVSQTVATASLRYRDDNGVYLTLPLESLGGGIYNATLPSPVCDDQPQFYIEIIGSQGFNQALPDAGPADPFTATVGVQTTVLNDNAETNIGWTVSGNATDGQWTRGVPAGAGDRGDPTSDGDGSGAAWLTDNVAGNSDVDNGSTILTSPVLDASHPESTIAYWRWFSNDTGASPNEDVMTVQVSSNAGANWTTLEIVGPTGPEASGGWNFKSFRVADFVTPTDQFRIRFNASDAGAGSVVEAGVDGVTLQAFACEDNACPADFNNDGNADFFDVQAYLAAFSAQDPAADLTNDGLYDFFDVQAFLNIFASGCP